MSTFKQVSIPIFPLTAYPPATSYQLFTYQAGTTTKQATYTDSTGLTPNSNPAIIQAGSTAPVYLTVFCQVGLSYKFVLAPSTDSDPPVAALWTVDNIQIDDNLDLTPYASISGGVLTLTNTALTNPKISTKILDTNGNGILDLSATANAVNDILIANAATGNAPKIRSNGEANRGLVLADSNGNSIITGASTASAVNNYTITNQVTGTPPIIQVSGDTNRNARLIGNGTGGVNLGSPSGTTPLVLEPGSTTNTQSHSMTLTGARTVTWPDCDVPNFYVQRASTNIAITSGTTTYIYNSVAPTTSNGTQIATVSITPKNSNNKLVVEAECLCSASQGATILLALFMGAGTNAVSAMVQSVPTAQQAFSLHLRYIVTASQTTALTFALRAATDGGTWYIGQANTNQTLGGIVSNYFTVTEYSA